MVFYLRPRSIIQVGLLDPTAGEASRNPEHRRRFATQALSLVVAVVALCTLGCVDTGMVPRSAPGEEMAKYRPIPPNARGFARPAEEGEITAAAARQIRAALDEANRHPVPDRGFPAPRFGIASRPLPGGALAMVVRDGLRSDVVFSTAALDDGVFMVADYLVHQDLEDHPPPVPRRVLTLQTIHTVLVQTDAGSETRTVGFESPGNGQHYITARLLDAAARQAESLVPQIGGVRFVVED